MRLKKVGSFLVAPTVQCRISQNAVAIGRVIAVARSLRVWPALIAGSARFDLLIDAFTRAEMKAAKGLMSP
jgi:hypothetical protein